MGVINSSTWAALGKAMCSTLTCVGLGVITTIHWVTSSDSSRLPIALATILALGASSLGACSLLGPQPNAQLTRAEAVAHQAGQEEIAHSLHEEVLRLCGHHADGRVPDSCTYELDPAEGDLLETLITTVGKAPEESKDLVLAQTLQLAKEEKVEVPELASISDSEVQEAAKKLLETEYGAIWALDYARAFISDQERIDALIAEHRKRVAVLVQALGDQAPGAEPGWLFSDTADAEKDPNAFISDIEALSYDHWVKAARYASTDAWRGYCIAVAANYELAS